VEVEKALLERSVNVRLLCKADFLFEQFMQIATRQNVDAVGHGLQSCTSAVRAVEVFHPITKEPLILVDTPGLDDTKLDLEIMKMMTAWLRKK
jgi:hypothetical protein